MGRSASCSGVRGLIMKKGESPEDMMNRNTWRTFWCAWVINFITIYGLCLAMSKHGVSEIHIPSSWLFQGSVGIALFVSGVIVIFLPRR